MHYVDLFDSAACRNPMYDPDLWHDPATFKVAVRVCKSCPLRARCLDFATDPDNEDFTEHGVWGGLDANWRSRLRNGRRNVPAVDRYEVVTFPAPRATPGMAASSL